MIRLRVGILESPCECSIEPPGSISHLVKHCLRGQLLTMIAEGRMDIRVASSIVVRKKVCDDKSIMEIDSNIAIGIILRGMGEM